MPEPTNGSNIISPCLLKSFNICLNNSVGSSVSESPQLYKLKFTPIIPVPENAPKPMFKHPKYKNPVTAWAYRTADNKIMGYVVRFETENGKEVMPHTYCTDEKGNKSWKWQTFEKPRPLYGLDWLAKYDKILKVLIVEGEKCAYDAHKILNVPVICWVGGRYGLRHADWSPLKGRKAVLWADNDKPGEKAMQEVAEILKGIAADVKFVKIPEAQMIGWDIADAIKEGWDRNKIFNYIKNNLYNPKTDKKKTDEPPKYSPTIFDKAPFRCLGYNQNLYFYLPYRQKQINSLTAQGHTKQNLLSLAKIEWWKAHFPSKSGVNWDLAISSIIDYSTRKGVFDVKKIRGRGAWYDEGRVVLHLGDRLLVDGKEFKVSEFQSKYIYELGKPIEIIKVGPMEQQKAFQLTKICSLLAWEKSIYAPLLAGWCVVAPICGALDWRPHLWLTGGPGTGKSWIMDHIIKPILGDGVLTVQSNTTEPGIRQALGSDALPVLFDEAEGSDKLSQERIQAIVELIRQASSESGGQIMKGTASGKPQFFHIRSCFCVASIGITIRQHADISRFSILGFTKHSPGVRVMKFEEIKAAVNQTITAEWSAGLRARSIKLIPVIRENAGIIAKAFAIKFGDQRLGDQTGVLLAGYYSLITDQIIKPIVAEDFLKFHYPNPWRMFGKT